MMEKQEKKYSHAPIAVGIVGGSGSGKTWLAQKLQARLGAAAASLCLDQFYQDRSHLSSEQIKRVNFDHPRAIDWPLLESALARCLAAKAANVPVYDFSTHSRTAQQQRVGPAFVWIMEGLWLFRRPAVRNQFDLRIFLDAPAQLRLRRRLERDLRSRGRTRESVLAQFQTTVEPMHRRYVAPQARWAHLLLSGCLDEKALTRILVEIEQLRLRALPQKS